MHVAFESLLGLAIGEERRFENMVVFPLIDADPAAPGYITLDEALGSGQAKITEVSEGGSVPELRFTNDSDSTVLLVDGEEYVGAKQNRIANITILAPARTTLTLPVSCVEAGRWHPTSAAFRTSPRAQFAEGRAKRVEQVSESMRSTGSRRSAQGNVWSDIDEKLARLSVHSRTMAMSDLYEAHEGSVGGFVHAIEPVAGQVGAIFAVNGRCLGCELFDSSETLGRLLPKVVRSFAVEALDPGALPDAEGSRAAAEAWFRSITDARVETYPAIGLGEDVRFSAGPITGAALVANGHVVHLTAHDLAAYRPSGGRV